ncbi:MAG: hypothetical protein QMD23_06275 [Candidatus Bathyarchaeia archaeon]|nr:hypothetical protein [Candidatus Bathyarchaeia archaeon]
MKDKERRSLDSLERTDRLRTNLLKTRKQLAAKLQNLRLLQIHFYTLRHWKATMEYHRIKDSYYVKNLLGRKTRTFT